MENNEKTFEQKIKELEKIVSELESGNVDLDDAIKKRKANNGGNVFNIISNRFFR